MPILPGTPNNINGIHPLAALVGQGGDGIGMGARMAAAKIAQDTQGVHSFMRSAMQKQVQQQQMQIQQKQFEINTGMKMEQMRIAQVESDKDRKARAAAQAQSMSLANARESRAAKQFEQSMAFQKEEHAFKVNTARRVEELNEKAFSQMGMIMDNSMATPTQQAGVDPNVDYGGELNTKITEAIDAEAPPIRHVAAHKEATPGVVGAMYDKRRNLIMMEAEAARARGSLSGVVSAMQKLNELEIETYEMSQAAEANKQAAGDQLDITHRFAADAYKDYMGITDEKSADEIYKNQGYAIADAEPADFARAMTVDGGVSMEALETAVNVLAKKRDAYTKAKISSEAVLRNKYDSGAAILGAKVFDKEIVKTEARLDKVTEVLIGNYKKLGANVIPIGDVIATKDNIVQEKLKLQNDIDAAFGIGGHDGELKALDDEVKKIASYIAEKDPKRIPIPYNNPKVRDEALERVSMLRAKAIAKANADKARMESLRQQQKDAEFTINRYQQQVSPKKTETKPFDEKDEDRGQAIRNTTKYPGIYRKAFMNARKGQNDERPRDYDVWKTPEPGNEPNN